MKKRYFNFKLYIDGLKQLRLIGIMSLVILILQSILIPIGHNIVALESTSAIYNDNMLSYNAFLPLCFCVVAPLMTLYLFNFLNKRNGSDFYLAFPDTRICISISFFLSIVTWLLMIILLTGATSLITINFMSRCTVIAESIPRTLINIFAGSLFVSAATFIAMTITGTNLSNIVVALLIIFLPRTFIGLMTFLMESILPFIDFNISGGLLSNNYNVVSDTLVSIFFGRDLFTPTATLVSGIYTLVIGIIYSVIGVILFNHRKSESAGNPALNRWVQLIIRTTIAMVICIMPVYGIISVFILKIGGSDKSESIFTIVVFYIIAIVTYFLYELITTRKWRNVRKAVPGLLLLFAMNILFGISILIGYNISIQNPINENNIQYVQLNQKNYTTDYFSKEAEKIKINDATANKIIADSLNRSIDNWREFHSDNLSASYMAIGVKIKANGKLYGRTINMTDMEYQNLLNILYSQPEYIQIFKILPDTKNLNITSNLGTIGDLSISHEELLNVYNTLKEEVQMQSLTMSDYAYIYGINTYDYDGSMCVSAETSDNHMLYQFFVIIDNRLPKTNALWNQYIQSSIEKEITNNASKNNIISQQQMIENLNQMVQGSANSDINVSETGVKTVNFKFYYYTDSGRLCASTDFYLDRNQMIENGNIDLKAEASYVSNTTAEDIQALAEMIPSLQNNIGATTISNNSLIIEFATGEGFNQKNQIFVVPREQIPESVTTRFLLTYR